MMSTDPTSHARSAPASVITGASKGLGCEDARRPPAAGHTVYLGASDATGGQRAAGDLVTRLLALDVTDKASLRAAAARLRQRVGRLDVLVNNACIVDGFAKPTGEVGAEDCGQSSGASPFRMADARGRRDLDHTEVGGRCRPVVGNQGSARCGETPEVS